MLLLKEIYLYMETAHAGHALYRFVVMYSFVVTCPLDGVIARIGTIAEHTTKLVISRVVLYVPRALVLNVTVRLTSWGNTNQTMWSVN